MPISRGQHKELEKRIKQHFQPRRILHPKRAKRQQVKYGQSAEQTQRELRVSDAVRMETTWEDLDGILQIIKKYGIPFKPAKAVYFARKLGIPLAKPYDFQGRWIKIALEGP